MFIPTTLPTTLTIITEAIVKIRPIIANLIVDTASLIFSSSPPDKINLIPPQNTKTKEAQKKIKKFEHVMVNLRSLQAVNILLSFKNERLNKI